MKTRFYFVLILVLFTFACTNNENSQKVSTSHSEVKGNYNSNINLSIFIDLSDRISPTIHSNPTMEFYKRDLGYLNSVIVGFKQHLEKKKVRLINDRIQLFIDPTPENIEINNIINGLRLTLDKNNISKGKIDSLPIRYNELTSKLYNQAIKDGKYIGSDIWGFFKEKVKDYCVSNQHRNILVIITDGYAYHKDNILDVANRSSYLTTKKINQLNLNNSNWESIFNQKDIGFITKRNDLENLEVLVLGINPYKTNPFEFDVIKTYWTKWFKEMGINNFAIKSADLPSNLDEVIRNFILNNN
ncbi:MAG TPA: hypothetical protein PK784_01135 [Tenuifilaceae bacterium]|nr:hypothetical protein [Tenuifilaceae bacterium]